MKVTKQETLYHEDYGATLKHKCGKKDSNIIPSLFFSHIFLGLLLFFMAFLFFLFLTCDNALENDDHHSSIYLQLHDYNSILEQSMTLYECLWRCTGICNEPRVTCMKIMNGGFATNTMSTTWSCKAIWQWWTCHDKRNGGKLHGNISRNGYGMP